MRYIELFAGVGGFRLGIEKTFYANRGQERGEQTDTSGDQGSGLQSPSGQDSGSQNGRPSQRPLDQPDERPLCVFANEFDKYAAQTYDKNFGGSIDTRDITTIRTDEIPAHDLLVGGFPCQAFSIAGKRQGFADTRGTLFFEIARILDAHHPTTFLLENVKGLLSHDSGQTFYTILSSLDELGYDCQWQVLNSKDFGVPQNRERIFIVGHLRGQSRPQVFPIIGASGADHSDGDSETGRGQVSRTLRSHQGGVDIDDQLVLENTRVRRLTPRECERLQGFPDDWTAGVSDTQRYRQMGNAVTVNVIEAIMSRLTQ